jgi:hypothetical protein
MTPQLRGTVNQYGKLIAAEARRCVGAAQALADAFPDFDEDGIPGWMPEAVVDRLEVVKIDEENYESPSAASFRSSARSRRSSSKVRFASPVSESW